MKLFFQNNQKLKFCYIHTLLFEIIHATTGDLPNLMIYLIKMYRYTFILSEKDQIQNSN